MWTLSHTKSPIKVKVDFIAVPELVPNHEVTLNLFQKSRRLPQKLFPGLGRQQYLIKHAGLSEEKVALFHLSQDHFPLGGLYSPRYYRLQG